MCFFLFFPRFFTRVIVLAGVNGDLVVSRQWAFFVPIPHSVYCRVIEREFFFAFSKICLVSLLAPGISFFCVIG